MLSDLRFSSNWGILKSLKYKKKKILHHKIPLIQKSSMTAPDTKASIAFPCFPCFVAMMPVSILWTDMFPTNHRVRITSRLLAKKFRIPRMTNWLGYKTVLVEELGEGGVQLPAPIRRDNLTKRYKQYLLLLNIL